MKKDDTDKMFLFRERKCANCGKEFLITSQDWVYKAWRTKGMIYFCSWKCVREDERKKDTKIDRRERIIRALRSGMTVKETAHMLHELPQKVVYWKKKIDNGEVKDDGDRCEDFISGTDGGETGRRADG